MRTKAIAVVFTVMCLLYAFQSMAKAKEKVYHTTPADFPTLRVFGERDGYLFLTGIDFSGGPGHILILDGAGELVYYKQFPKSPLVTDFRPQVNGTLSYWIGRQVPGGFSGELHVMNSAYQETEVITRSDVYVDNHEFTILPNGNRLYLFYTSVTVGTNGTIPYAPVFPWIQEVTPQGKTVAEFKGWEEFDPADTLDQYVGQTGIIHTNAVEVDKDGNWLLSSRNLSEITKVERTSGEILWRLGGKENEFELRGDTRWFSHQHDIRRLPNGHISLYDNGVGMKPSYSRYVEYEIDEESLVVTMTREIRHVPDVFADIMGSGRVLSNGNTLIGWGGSNDPAVTEYGPTGKFLFELSLPGEVMSYRAYHLDEWHATPTIAPTLVITENRLFYSWNGATDVSGYQLWADGKLVATQARVGFENSHALLPKACVYQVKAIDLDRMITATSNPVFSPSCTSLYFPTVSR